MAARGNAPGRSGRRELAESIVREAGPLTARVIVNRVWGWHVGQPLVRTPSDFGRLGDPPSHPRLLDDLSARFIEAGWSLKWLHREIVLSATWQQASRSSDDNHDRDPDNRWLWRMNRRRLEAEAWRDSLLSLSGQLDTTQFGPSAQLDDAQFRRRTVYGIVSRQKPADLFRLFDFPDAKQHAESRILTTTPLQHLYLLNSPFLQDQADAAVERAVCEEPDDAHQRVQRLFERILLRPPTDAESSQSLALVHSSRTRTTYEAWELLASALLATNEVLYID